MKVLHLISGRMYGGGQKVALDLCTKLNELAGVEADLGLLGCTVEQLRFHSAFVVPYDGNYSSLHSLTSTAYRLRRILRERAYDVVHSHGWDADVIAYWAMMGLPAIHVVHLHVTPAWVHSSTIKHRARRAVTRCMFARHGLEVLAVSHAVKDHWAEAFKEATPPVKVVHNGVDTECYRPPGSRREAAPTGEFVLGTAGRLAAQKGLTYLLQAMPRVIAQSGKRVRLDIAGSGSQRAQLEAECARLGLNAHVRFLGSVSDMAGFYRSIDAFVLPAVSDEGLPLVVLEAMATGLSVVATDVGGTEEAVRDGVDGRIVPPQDPEALAAALLKIISNDSLRERMGSSGRAHACQSFSIEAQVGKVHALYHEVLAARRRLSDSRKTASVAAKV